MLITHITKSFEETQKLGEDLAKEIQKQKPRTSAVVLALSGNLGGGKTTFLQGLAKGLGVKEKVLSPTFVIMKNFKFKAKNDVQNTRSRTIHTFYHIDCYRLNSEEDILELGLKEILKDPQNIVAVEWPEKIQSIMPKTAILIKFRFIDNNKREIQIFKKG